MALIHFLSLLSFTILLSIAISALGAHEGNTKAPSAKCGLPPAELEQLVKELNARKKEVAEKKQIANMHEIRYDPELEKKAASCASSKDTACSVGEKSSSHPTQTGFAVCNIPKFTVYGERDTTQMLPTQVYAHGPNLPMKPEEEIKKGAPGSQCPNGKAESGLCKASWHVDPMPPSITEGPNHEGKVSYLISTVVLLVFFV